MDINYGIPSDLERIIIKKIPAEAATQAPPLAILPRDLRIENFLILIS